MDYILNLNEISALPTFIPPHHTKTVDRILIDQSKGAKGLAVWYGEMEPEGVALPHSHENMEQLFLILQGEAIFEIEGREHRTEKDSLIFIPSGHVHKVTCIGGQIMKVLIIMSPPPQGPEEWRAERR
jgi:quercetin dioxygenase-like cupin family protein